MAGTPLIRSREAQLESTPLRRGGRFQAQSLERASARTALPPGSCSPRSFASRQPWRRESRWIDSSIRGQPGNRLAWRWYSSRSRSFWRRRSFATASILVALFALGAAWHHYRYTDTEPDDLALNLTETGRQSWVRGIVRDALGVQQVTGDSASEATTHRESQPALYST